MANRYKELKYEGKTYTQKYQIDEIIIDNGMNWFLDCEVENARIEIIKETIVFNAGIFYNGVWEYGVVRDADWRNGVFKNGVIYNGTFKKLVNGEQVATPSVASPVHPVWPAFHLYFATIVLIKGEEIRLDGQPSDFNGLFIREFPTCRTGGLHMNKGRLLGSFGFRDLSHQVTREAGDAEAA
jgi:hypothetical protein